MSYLSILPWQEKMLNETQNTGFKLLFLAPSSVEKQRQPGSEFQAVYRRQERGVYPQASRSFGEGEACNGNHLITTFRKSLQDTSLEVEKRREGTTTLFLSPQKLIQSSFYLSLQIRVQYSFYLLIVLFSIFLPFNNCENVKFSSTVSLTTIINCRLVLSFFLFKKGLKC